MTGTPPSAPSVAIVVAGGSGERLGAPGGKQLLALGGRPVLAHTLESIARSASIDAIVVVCHPERVDEYADATRGVDVGGLPVSYVAGGETRQDSVSSGLTEARDRYAAAVVAVHDGARPLVSGSDFDRTIARLSADPHVDGAVVGYRVVDTLKLATGEMVDSTPDRSRYWAVQTPQVFAAGTLAGALEAASASGFVGTDDASLVERIGGSIALVPGSRDNIKITVAEDVAIAEAILGMQDRTGG